MLLGLRLDTFIGGNHKQDQVYTADSGQHVANKTFVAGDVNESQAQQFAVWGCELKVGEANIYSDAAALLLLQAVGINAGERLNQRSFAVINVSGSANDDAAGRS